MAEAHQGVAFSFAVTEDEGLNLNVSREALKAVLRSGMRNWRKKVSRFAVNIFYLTPLKNLIETFYFFFLKLQSLNKKIKFLFKIESCIKWCLSKSSNTWYSHNICGLWIKKIQTY
jgi:hypothetical protein